MEKNELVCEYRGKITSLKVLPFDDGSQEVKYELTQIIHLSGRLAGTGFGSNYVRQGPDGTSVTKFYGVWTSTDGASIRVEFGGNAVSLGGGKARFRTTGMLKTTAPSLDWLNTMNLAFEGEGDFSTMEVTGRVYAWP